MGVIAIFMVVWGLKLVQTTWGNSVDEFPWLSVGITYLPIVVSGAMMLLFVVERLTIGPPPRDGATPTYRSSNSHGYRRSPSQHVFLLRDRHADRLCAGAVVARRRALDRPAGRRGHAAICQRRREGLDADHPVLRAGGRHHGRGRHGPATGRFCGRGRRLHAHARRALAGQHPRDHDHERHFGIVGRRYVGDRFGDDPPDGREGLSAGIRNQRHHQRLAAGDHHSAEP